ncbi:hydroxymethylpyrimidine/phosphomethylpyrimidine kinase [Geofilum rubicundum]|uniref:hydroxymethylpyrimidine kinase n=1 Tax=Geofilum rubicundum JCM 15548 TaxID=1236989 RepID=A0A0E9M0X8_9BACT|nr:hydroxymethylpyrimidine/phosphomethylpyrimidine kinase [Geofilum rubicundum]GAO31457.1 hydroxymethylpyrimidine phosphate kinase ThiD [Geofilum rubicundum JCM 15548]
MEDRLPIALSIGGWDPCGGAGLAADIKTFEMSGVLGMGVCTAVTCQVHDAFEGMEWTDDDLIFSQLKLLISRYELRAVKFGIVPSMAVLSQCIALLKASFPGIKMIWDPILKASAGYAFHANTATDDLSSVLSAVTLITPNTMEAGQLWGTADARELQKMLQPGGALLLKGGHAVGHANDVLIEEEGIRVIAGEKFANNPGKHGSGCVLSAAICAQLAKGEGLYEACVSGKRYAERYIRSTGHLLGRHFQGDQVPGYQEKGPGKKSKT